MKFTKFFLVILLIIPLSSIAAEPHISDVLEGNAQSRKKIEPAAKNLHKSNIKSDSAYNKKFNSTKHKITRARQDYPEVGKLYDDISEKATKRKAEAEEGSGTDLALKRLCAEFEKQFIGLIWKHASAGVGSDDNFAEKTHRERLSQAIIEEGTEMGDITSFCIEELSRSASMQKNKRR